MTISLVTDSSCDLPASLIEQYQIHVVPITIRFGETAYLENVTITPTEFYHIMEQNKIFPKTSQPSVGEFVKTYTELAQVSDEIISIHVSSKLSGTCQSATLAAAKVANIIKVHVIDSLAGSAGAGWMLVQTAQLIAQGNLSHQIIPIIEAKRPQISIFFAVDNLKFAQMSGRISKLQTMIGIIFNIKPIIGLENGLIQVCGRVRSNRVAMEHIVELTQEKMMIVHVKSRFDAPVYVGVLHAQAPCRANTLLDLARSRLNIQDYFVKELAISLAVHFGSGTLGLVAYPIE